jgi:hypothetical protein
MSLQQKLFFKIAFIKKNRDFRQEISLHKGFFESAVFFSLFLQFLMDCLLYIRLPSQR